MSGTAQVTSDNRNRGLSPRSAARVRRLGLRGAAIVYLGGVIALPVAAILWRGFGEGLGSFAHALRGPGAVAAIRLTLITATITALVNAVMGTLLAYVLVRYRFRGRAVLSTVADLPIAIPTATSTTAARPLRIQGLRLGISSLPRAAATT